MGDVRPAWCDEFDCDDGPTCAELGKDVDTEIGVGGFGLVGEGVGLFVRDVVVEDDAGAIDVIHCKLAMLPQVMPSLAALSLP
jgi:hypothetical protein